MALLTQKVSGAFKKQVSCSLNPTKNMSFPYTGSDLTFLAGCITEVENCASLCEVSVASSK